MLEEILGGIFSLGQAIYERSQMALTNQTQCKRLAERVGIILSSVKSLGTNRNAEGKVKNADLYEQPLQNLKACLEDCCAFIDYFTTVIDKKKLKKLMKAKDTNERFDELNEDLRKAIEQLNIGFNAQQIVNNEQDVQDKAKDVDYLIQHQAEIAQRQGEQMDNLAERLASMRMHVIGANGAGAKPNVDGLDTGMLIPYHEIERGPNIARGSFGNIYAGCYLTQKVALKAVEGGVKKANVDEFVREAKIMFAQHHPNVVLLYGASMEQERLCMVMEYMEQGSLKDYLSKKRFTPKQQKAVALDIAKGLLYLHHHDVIHCDLKSANILLDSSNRAKITDFGLSFSKAANIKPIAKRTESYEWQPPEFLQGAPSTEKADIYGFGMILLEIVTGQVPYASWKETFVPAVIAGKREVIPANVPEVLRQLIARCWDNKPSRRPALTDIIEQLEQYEPKELLTAEEYYQKGLQLEEKGNFVEAYQQYQASAAQNYMRAFTCMGFFALKGLGGLKADSQKACENFLKAAEMGHVRAMMNLAGVLEKGEGVTKDLPGALKWYKKAADAGDEKAQKRYNELKATVGEASSLVRR